MKDFAREYGEKVSQQELIDPQEKLSFYEFTGFTEKYLISGQNPTIFFCHGPIRTKKKSVDSISRSLPLFRSYNARAHMAWGTRVALRRPSQNRLKIGVRREGTVSNQLLETRRLTRTDG